MKAEIATPQLRTQRRGTKRVKLRAELSQAILNQGTPEREKNKAI